MGEKQLFVGRGHFGFELDLGEEDRVGEFGFVFDIEGVVGGDALELCGFEGRGFTGLFIDGREIGFERLECGSGFFLQEADEGGAFGIADIGEVECSGVVAVGENVPMDAGHPEAERLLAIVSGDASSRARPPGEETKGLFERAEGVEFGSAFARDVGLLGGFPEGEQIGREAARIVGTHADEGVAQLGEEAVGGGKFGVLAEFAGEVVVVFRVAAVECDAVGWREGRVAWRVPGAAWFSWGRW